MIFSEPTAISIEVLAGPAISAATSNVPGCFTVIVPVRPFVRVQPKANVVSFMAGLISNLLAVHPRLARRHRESVPSAILLQARLVDLQRPFDL